MPTTVLPATTPQKLTVSTPVRGRSASFSGRRTSNEVPVPSLHILPAPTQGLLTPPSSRRCSATNPSSKSLSLSVSHPTVDEKIQTPTTPDRPRAHSRCHQRSKSACLLPQAGIDLPGYAKPTQRSRSRSRAASLSNDTTSDETLSGTQGHTIVTRHGVTHKGATLSTFKITSNGTNPNVLRIDSDERFRLEVRIHGTNAIEVIAIPTHDEPAPSSPLVVFTPPVSPSAAAMLDLDMLIPELLTIPALDVYSPVELDSTPPSSIPVRPTVEDGETKKPTRTPPPPPPSPPPQNEEEHLEAVTAFVEDRNLSRFFKSEKEDAGEILEMLSAKAAVLVKELEEQKTGTDEATSFIKDAATVADVVKVSLYDQVIFCDDSFSMQMYGLVDTLKDALTGVAQVALALNKTSSDSGINLRFINYKNDGHMNNIASISEIEKALSEVPFDGHTMLGRQLKRKVLEPFLVDRLERQNGKLEKPLLITIITDGVPQGEKRSELKDTILWCKQYIEYMGYGPWAVGFHIAQIGDDTAAREFLQEIEDDPAVRDHVYVSKGLMEGNIATSGAEWGKQNALRWLNSLVKAIEH